MDAMLGRMLDAVLVGTSMFVLLWAIFYTLLIRSRKRKEARLKVWFEQTMARDVEYDPKRDGLILPIAHAACYVYRNHIKANSQVINHLSFTIFSACQDGYIKSYDMKTLFPRDKYQGVASKWGSSYLFMGKVERANIFNTAVNLLEAMEWLSNEGFVFCRAPMYELQNFVGKGSKVIQPLVEVDLKVEKPLANRERNALLVIIGGALELLQDKRAVKADTSNPTKIIEALVAAYSDKEGISTRNLQGKFAEAKRALESD